MKTRSLGLHDVLAYYTPYHSTGPQGFDVVYTDQNTEIAQLPNPPNRPISFYESIVMKKEFAECRLPQTAPPPAPNTYTPHQTFMARFMSKHTPYHRMLAFHEVGTGKTALYAAMIEAFRSIDKSYKILVLVRNETLMKTAYSDLATKFTQSHYMMDQTSPLFQEIYEEYKAKTTGREKSPEEYVRERALRAIKKVYRIVTYRDFTKEWGKMSPKSRAQQYNHSIIVIDEVHNLKHDENSTEFKEIYEAVWGLTHKVPDVRILLLSGTPMHDNVAEFKDVINLLLPKNKQMKDEDLDNTNFDTDGEYLFPDEFKSKFLYGIVSYVRAMKTATITVKFLNDDDRRRNEQLWLNTRNDIVYPLIATELYPLQMTRFQTEVYWKSMRRGMLRSNWGLPPIDIQVVEAEEGSEVSSVAPPNATGAAPGVDEEGERPTQLSVMWAAPMNAALFSFPILPIPRGTAVCNLRDGHYVTERGFNIRRYLDENTVTLTQEFRTQALENGINRGDSQEVQERKKLENLKCMSIKYWFVISQLLSNPTKKAFAYTHKVSDDGVLMLIALLKCFGFQPFHRGEVTNTTPARRFLALTSKTSTATETQELVDKFNQDNNVNGEMCQIVIGSKVVGEGISLKAVRMMFLITPWWNEATMDQAIGRAIRSWSHEQLPPANRQIDVYRLAAIPQTVTANGYTTQQSIRSVNFHIYAQSQDKDKRVKSVEKMIKEAAVDCVLNRKRNILSSDVSGSKECHYLEECGYDCTYVDPALYNSEHLHDFYETRLSSANRQQYVPLIQTLAQSFRYGTAQPQLSEEQKQSILAIATELRLPFLNEENEVCVLRLRNNTLVLQPSYITDTDSLFYAQSMIDDIIKVLRVLYERKTAYEFDELYQLVTRNLPNVNVSLVVMARALNECIQKNVRFYNRYHFINYLRTDRDMYFLVDHPLHANFYSSAFYADHVFPSTHQGVDVMDTFLDAMKLSRTRTIQQTLEQNQGMSPEDQRLLLSLVGLGDQVGVGVGVPPGVDAIETAAIDMYRRAFKTFQMYGIVKKDKKGKQTFSIKRLFGDGAILFKTSSSARDDTLTFDQLKSLTPSNGRECGNLRSTKMLVLEMIVHLFERYIKLLQADADANFPNPPIPFSQVCAEVPSPTDTDETIVENVVNSVIDKVDSLVTMYKRDIMRRALSEAQIRLLIDNATINFEDKSAKEIVQKKADGSIRYLLDFTNQHHDFMEALVSNEWFTNLFFTSNPALNPTQQNVDVARTYLHTLINQLPSEVSRCFVKVLHRYILDKNQLSKFCQELQTWLASVEFLLTVE